MALVDKTTEQVGNELFEARYQGYGVDAIDHCLIRAKGIAGLLADVCALSHQGTYCVNAESMELAARALQMEITDAIIMIDHFYRDSPEQQQTKEFQSC